MNNTALKRSPDSLAQILDFTKLTREGVTIASFAGFNADGRFLVALTDNPLPLPALSTVGLGVEDVGAQIVVAFENGEVRRPIIIGRLQEQVAAVVPTFKLDGERVVLQAEREIELRCGESSIILTKAGKVLIRGNFVLSRSRGANKIKGAFIDIN